MLRRTFTQLGMLKDSFKDSKKWAILTVNRRLALQLHRCHPSRCDQKETGAQEGATQTQTQTWQTPDILPINASPSMLPRIPFAR